MATTAVLNAGIRLAAARPTARSTAARYIAARSAASRFTTPGSASSHFTAPRSASSRLTAAHPAGGFRSGSAFLPLRCAADAPPPPAESSPNNPPPPPLPSTSRWSIFYEEIKGMGFSVALMCIALGLGVMASKENPKAKYTYVVTLCEKSEKIHKFLSHVLPIVVAIFKSFR